jgi:hypothetical protein
MCNLIFKIDGHNPDDLLLRNGRYEHPPRVTVVSGLFVCLDNYCYQPTAVEIWRSFPSLLRTSTLSDHGFCFSWCWWMWPHKGQWMQMSIPKRDFYVKFLIQLKKNGLTSMH